MGVNGDNLRINSGLHLPYFILNYMIIRVKEKELNKEKYKEQREGETSETRENEEETKKAWEVACLITILRWR